MSHRIKHKQVTEQVKHQTANRNAKLLYFILVQSVFFKTIC